jgi:hypothetical protein
MPSRFERPGSVDDLVVMRRGRIIDALQVAAGAQEGQAGGLHELAGRISGAEQGGKGEDAGWRATVAFALDAALIGGFRVQAPAPGQPGAAKHDG